MRQILILASLFVVTLTNARSPSPASTFPYFLQPLLTFDNDTAVTSAAGWINTRRAQVSALLESTILGARPIGPSPPLTRATVLNSTSIDNGVSAGSTSIFVELEFTVLTRKSVAFIIEVLVPSENTGTALLPIFLTQCSHRGWATLGLSRGYLAVVYAACDTRDAAPDFQRAYGQNSSSMALIHARAFVASRVLDYVLGPTFGIGFPNPKPLLNTSSVCISGHSRNGKQSVIAAAFDERFTAVVGSSPGAPVSTPWQFGSANFYGEPPDAAAGVAPFWWVASAAQYVTHPEQLPIDGHGILAMIAPRKLAICAAWTDREGDNTIGVESGARAARDVFTLLNVTDNIHVMHRPGDHHGFIDVDAYFDWFDYVFGRLSPNFPLAWAGQSSSSMNISPFTRTDLTAAGGFSFSQWNEAFGNSTPSPPPATAPAVERLSWLMQLREPSSGGIFGRATSYAEEGPANFAYPSIMLSHDYESQVTGVKRVSLSFGDYVTANVYFPSHASSTTTLPAVIWLHPYSYATGYFGTYGASQVVPALVLSANVMVVAFDQVGFATRLRQGGSSFFARHGGNASPFGHMLKDVRSAVDFLICQAVEGSTCWEGGDPGLSPSTLSQLPRVNMSHITLAGYSLGGAVSVLAAALDSRVTGVAAIASFTPWRTDTNDRATGGIRRLYELHALIPRLGLFEKNTSQIPVDYDEILTLLAPRPTLIIAPRDDRDATFTDVETCVERARGSWGTSSALLEFFSQEGGTRMGDNETNTLIAWLVKANN